MTPSELRKAQKQILDHATDAGSLSDVVTVLAKYVYRLSPDAYFEPLKSAASEWVLRPTNWIAFYLSTGRSGIDPKIIVSVDVWRQNIPEEVKLEIKQGRTPQWSKFSITDVSHIRDAISIIDYAKR